MNIPAFSQEADVNTITYNQRTYNLYPATIDALPPVPSPYTAENGMEIVVALLKTGQYTLVPVTIENKTPHIPYGGRQLGKGDQLTVDEADFPTLAETGLHSEQELERTETITGKLVAEINETGRPEQASGAGFMAIDEDIISVLTGDNRLVAGLNLTHPQLARPLFHIWNLILQAYEHGDLGRNLGNVEYLLYNGRQVRFGEVYPTRGFQESLFNDEIWGTFQINIYREPDDGERAFIYDSYSHLANALVLGLIDRLSYILTAEMEPYYVMRYGFYEGHTDYRVDPIAIAFIFGLKSMEEIEAAFPGELYDALTTYFTRENLN